MPNGEYENELYLIDPTIFQGPSDTEEIIAQCIEPRSVHVSASHENTDQQVATLVTSVPTKEDVLSSDRSGLTKMSECDARHQLDPPVDCKDDIVTSDSKSSLNMHSPATLKPCPSTKYLYR